MSLFYPVSLKRGRGKKRKSLWSRFSSPNPFFVSSLGSGSREEEDGPPLTGDNLLVSGWKLGRGLSSSSYAHLGDGFELPNLNLKNAAVFPDSFFLCILFYIKK